MKAFSLNEKRALITGGGSGIGFGIAKTFIEAGANVIIVGQDEQKLIEATALLGNRCQYRQFDITKSTHIPDFVEEVENNLGAVDILVNCAGKHLKKTAIDTTDAEFLDILNVHLLSTFSLTREFAKKMMPRQHGSIIFISSMSAIMSMEKVVAYSTAKTAILGLMRGLLVEFAQYGIRVNAIAPGWIETPMLHKAIDNDAPRRQKITNRIPTSSFGAPEDIGYAALYLVSEAGKYVNGVFLPVDGGAAVGF
jgi:gluconate 5-dehydrogenase